MSFIRLSAACVAVYRELTGGEPQPSQAADAAALDRVAEALAKVVPIYLEDASGARREMATAELLQGRFAEGGRVFVTGSGAELRPLSVARRDVAIAATLLAKAGITFPLPPGRSAQVFRR